MGSSLISSHGRKWKGGGPSGENHEWQAGREGPSALRPAAPTAVWGCTFPAAPLPSSSKWGKLRGPLIPPGRGLLTSFITPPLKKKLSSCHVTATSCPTVVPGMFVVGCHGDGRLGHYPGSCGEQTAPPSRPTVGGWLEGACPRGCFRLSVCGLRCPRSPMAPQTSVCGKESQPPSQTECRGDCDHVWLRLAVANSESD